MARKDRHINRDYSEQLGEVISKPLPWLLKNGISFVFLVSFLLLGLTYFIEVPESIPSSFILNKKNSNEVISSKVDGKLAGLLVKNNDWVLKNSIIGFIENPASHVEVLSLLDTLKSIEDTVSLSKIKLPAYKNLGELQASYTQLFQLLLRLKKDIRFSSSNSYYQNDLEIIQSVISSLNNEQQLKEGRLALLQSKSVADPISKKWMLELTMELKGSLRVLKSNLNALNQLHLNTNNTVKSRFFYALRSFINQAESWKSKYVLSNYTEGKIEFAAHFQEKEQVLNGQKLFYIYSIPNMELLIAENYRNKLKLGKTVQLKVKSPLSKKYLYLNGKINFIDNYQAGKSLFLVKISLMNLSNDLQAKLKDGTHIEVITNRDNMLDRIWQNLLKSSKI